MSLGGCEEGEGWRCELGDGEGVRVGGLEKKAMFCSPNCVERLYGCLHMTLNKLHLLLAVVAENLSRGHTTEEVLLFPERESETVMSMQEGRRVSQSTAAGESVAEELT